MICRVLEGCIGLEEYRHRYVDICVRGTEEKDGIGGIFWNEDWMAGEFRLKLGCSVVLIPRAGGFREVGICGRGRNVGLEKSGGAGLCAWGRW